MKLITLCIIATILYIAAVACCGCVSVKRCKQLQWEAWTKGSMETAKECTRSQQLMYDYYTKNYERLPIEEIQRRNGGK